MLFTSERNKVPRPYDFREESRHGSEQIGLCGVVAGTKDAERRPCVCGTLFILQTSHQELQSDRTATTCADEENVRFHWSAECEVAFRTLKEKLTTAPIMALPRDDGMFTLDTDALKWSIGAVLSQGQDGKERVIAYGSRLYNKAKSNYCTTCQELLAVVYFVKLFRQYLLGRSFIIRTDHAALKGLKRTPEPAGQQSRWLEQLSAYDFKIQHRPGIGHSNADALRRIPGQQ